MKPTTPSLGLVGRFYWPSPEYSTPADNLCWDIPPAPNRDFKCVRALGHPGKCQHQWSPVIKDHSHKAACDMGQRATSVTATTRGTGGQQS
jgi:hypothetical protein